METLFHLPNNYLTDINRINFKSYNSRRRAQIWASFNWLQKSEKVILLDIREKILNKKILDIGVGGGRTTPFLLEMSKDYTAIDYSPSMVKVFKKKYPNLNIRQCDARNLDIFINEKFDFIFFSFNGIDYVDHNDRLLILKEIFKVLNKNGYFLFSSHNRNVKSFNNYTLKLNLSIPHLSPKKIFSYFLAKRNRRRNKTLEKQTNEYAIINDPGHTYSLMTYFISINYQIIQLESVGFSKIKVFNKLGREIFSDTESDWIHYLATK